MAGLFGNRNGPGLLADPQGPTTGLLADDDVRQLLAPSATDRKQALWSALAEFGAGLGNAQGTYGSWGGALNQGLARANQGFDASLERSKQERLLGFDLMPKLKTMRDDAAFDTALQDASADLPPGLTTYGRHQLIADRLADNRSIPFSRVTAFAKDGSSLAPPKPITRDRYVDGGRVVQEQLNPMTGQYEEYGEGARFAPRPDTWQIVPGKDGYVAFNTTTRQAIPLTTPDGAIVTKGDSGGTTTEGERKAGAATMVMENAERDFRAAVGDGGSMSTFGYAASHIPAVGQYFVPEPDQKAQAAMIDWYREKLRLESGATIGDAEALGEAKRYFPMPGDSPETIAQKERARTVAMEGLKLKAGKAAPKENAADTKALYNDYLKSRNAAYKAGNMELVKKMDAQAREMGILK